MEFVQHRVYITLLSIQTNQSGYSQYQKMIRFLNCTLQPQFIPASRFSIFMSPTNAVPTVRDSKQNKRETRLVRRQPCWLCFFFNHEMKTPRLQITFFLLKRFANQNFFTSEKLIKVISGPCWNICLYENLIYIRFKFSCISEL